jgi:hypothetical protein
LEQNESYDDESVVSDGSALKDDEDKELIEDSDEDGTEADPSTAFDAWSLSGLISAADKLGIDLSPSEEVAHSSTELTVECPFCEISYDLCGDDRCVTEARRRKYESARPELVWNLLNAN